VGLRGEQGKAPKRVVLISGGVGGARMARGLAEVLPSDVLSVVVNVGDDLRAYGLAVSPDLDTVLYTLAGIEGPHGWGIAGDTYSAMERLSEAGLDTEFKIGDKDLVTNLVRTAALDRGETLSQATVALGAAMGVEVQVFPATDAPVKTKVAITGGEWLDFQDYFVIRGNRDDVTDLRFDGAESASPAPGVVEAISAAEAVVIAPSNPPLSVWPVLAIPGIRSAIEAAPRVVGVSPLFGGVALKGPAHRVMKSLGLPPGNLGVLAAYQGLLSDLVIDVGDGTERDTLAGQVKLHITDIRMPDLASSARLARSVLEIL